MLDDGIETDGSVAGLHQRQRGIALQRGQRPGGDHPARLQQHQMIGQPLDLGHVVADIDDRQRQRFMQPFEKGQHLVLGQPVEGG